MSRRFERRSKIYRGNRHHGYGQQRGHKKHGQKGGRGNAGWDTHRWMHTIVTGQKFGKNGFVHPPRASPPHLAINIGELTEKIDYFLEKGYATKEGREITIDTTKMGVTKVIGKGSVKKMIVIAESFSASAKEKIEKAGGTAKIIES